MNRRWTDPGNDGDWLFMLMLAVFMVLSVFLVVLS